MSFPSDGQACAAWFYRPAGEPDPAPVIVMAHGLTGTRHDRLGPFAERFAAAGLAALVFDYRGFGDSEGEPDLFEPERQLTDWRAAIAFARSLPGIDPDRVATFGSSLGGGNALAAAAEDPRVVAAISQVPFLDRDSQTYTGHREVAQQMLDVARRGGYLPAVGQPHEAAFIRAPAAEAGWRHVVAIGEDSRPSAKTRAGATDAQQHGYWVRRTARSHMRPPCTAPGWSASPLTIKSRSPARPSKQPAAHRMANCAFIRESITSTSTTASNTKPLSPTNSASSTAISCSLARDTAPTPQTPNTGRERRSRPDGCQGNRLCHPCLRLVARLQSSSVFV